MKKEGISQAFASQTDLMKRKSEELASNLENNIKILSELMDSDVSYLNLHKVSFQRKSLCFGYKDERLRATSTTAYAKKGPISVKNSKIIIPEAHYYESEKLLDGGDKFSRNHNLITGFSYNLYWTLHGEHKQTEDWHLFYRIGGFCGPGGIDATSEHGSVYVLSGYEKFKKLETICKDIMKKEPEFFTETKHTDDMGSYEEKKGNPWKYKPDILKVYSKMPWPIIKELHFLAGSIGPISLPDIKKLRKLIGISEIDESYAI